MNKTYIIMFERDVTEMVVMASLNEEGTYRKSLDGAQALFKFDRPHPDCCAGAVKYTHSEILDIMQGADWDLEAEL
jgi:hypothetical protein